MKGILTLVSILMLGLVMACGQFDYYPQEYIVGLTPLSATTEKSNCTNIGNTGCFNVIVDYNQPLSKMISAGKYDEQQLPFSGDDEQPFTTTAGGFPIWSLPIQGKGRVSVELVLVHLTSRVTRKEVREYLASEKLEAASLEHLLALGAAYPDLQKQFPIFAIKHPYGIFLGWYWPFLGQNGQYRLLSIYSLGRDPEFDFWPKNARILAIRKKVLLP